MRILFALIIVSFSCSFGQKIKISSDRVGVVNLKNGLNSDWRISLQNLESPSPGGDSYKSFLVRKKQIIESNNPRKTFSNNSRTINSDDTLRVGKSFRTNIGSHGVPNDNSMAISNDGILVSAFNSSIYVYDTEADSALGEVSLNFFRDQIGLTAHSYDPKMVYDPNEDRFILVFLVGTLATNSNIIVCFSETADPMANWNVYSLSGNPLNDTSWSDYPAISITKNDLFITMNLLIENMSWQTAFKQTVIWQVNKEEGYDGDASVLSNLWTGNNEGGINIRNMHPVRGGFDIKGPNQYFLSNRNFATESDSIYLIEITNSYSSGVAQKNIQLLKSDIPYYLSPFARQQKFSFKKFYTNDSRVLGGVIENDEIQFVQNSLNPTNGSCSVFHGVISNVSSNPSINATIISDDSLDIGYPNIVYGGIIGGEKKSIIGFNHSSPWHFAGNSAIYFDGQNYSDMKMVKKGDNYVAAQLGSYQRWGDYFGIQRKYNEPCKVWLTGYYGGTDKVNYTWASEIFAPGDCFDTVVKTPQQNGNLFPNPTIDFTEIHFNLENEQFIVADIIDRRGEVVKILYEDKAKSGENRLLFSVKNLASGLYFLRIYNGKNKILTKKLVRR